tara:strand:+ start:11985 stop:12209 length:225 start_codon:yes stop_codon:yes gene_type:complete
MSKTRAEIEAKRGIVRDEKGRIIRDKAFHKAKIETLKQRIEDCDRRKAKAKELIEYHRGQIKAGRSTRKTKSTS